MFFSSVPSTHRIIFDSPLRRLVSLKTENGVLSLQKYGMDVNFE